MVKLKKKTTLFSQYHINKYPLQLCFVILFYTICFIFLYFLYFLKCPFTSLEKKAIQRERERKKSGTKRKREKGRVIPNPGEKIERQPRLREK